MSNGTSLLRFFLIISGCVVMKARAERTCTQLRQQINIAIYTVHFPEADRNIYGRVALFGACICQLGTHLYKVVYVGDRLAKGQ